MSQANVEIVRRAVKSLQEGDPRDVFAQGLAAPNAQFHAARDGVTGARTYVGAEGFIEYHRIWTENFEDWTLRLTDLHDIGDRVLAFAHQVAVGKGSGVSVEMEVGMLITLRDGLITDIRAFTDRAEALEAAGLSE
jgi:ketosteroid isomerase-like protein